MDHFSFFYSHNFNIIKPSFLPQWTKLYSTRYKKCIVHTKIKSYIRKEIRLVDLLHTAVIFISYLIHIQASSSEQAFLKQFFKAINDSFPSIDGETERKPWQDFIQTGNSGGCRNYSFNPCPEQHNIRTLLTSLRLGFPNNMISITKGILKLNSDSGFIFLIFFWLLLFGSCSFLISCMCNEVIVFHFAFISYQFWISRTDEIGLKTLPINRKRRKNP